MLRAFSFGTAALPTLAMLIAQRGAPVWAHELVFALFLAANAVFAVLIVKTIALLAEGRLLPLKVAAR